MALLHNIILVFVGSKSDTVQYIPIPTLPSSPSFKTPVSTFGGKLLMLPLFTLVGGVGSQGLLSPGRSTRP